MNCLTCQWKLGAFSLMDEVEPGMFLCRVCKTMKASTMAAPVMMARSGISRALFLGGFLLLLLASVVFTAFPELQAGITSTSLFSMYLVYFGLAFQNFRRHIYA